jgi:hypothetical protein
MVRIPQKLIDFACDSGVGLVVLVVTIMRPHQPQRLSFSHIYPELYVASRSHPGTNTSPLITMLEMFTSAP